MIAYKVFDKDWKCRAFQYKIGEQYCIEKLPILCEVGFHACAKLIQCFNYYDFDPKNKVAIVELMGDIIGSENDKYVTNEIKIIKEMSWNEVLNMVNTGNNNAGIGNSGDSNSGYGNSGDRNSGDRNSGDGNSGYRNSGYRNSGNNNSGDGNSGNFNCANYHSGDFNTKVPEKIYFFNNLIAANELEQIKNSHAYFILNRFVLIKYRVRRMSGKYGDYRYLSYKNSFRYFWRNLSVRERKEIINMPYFDKNIFCQITGVKV